MDFLEGIESTMTKICGNPPLTHEQKLLLLRAACELEPLCDALALIVIETGMCVHHAVDLRWNSADLAEVILG